MSCAAGLGASPFVPTAVIRSPSTTTVAFFFGVLTPSIRFARRKKIRPMGCTSVLWRRFRVRWLELLIQRDSADCQCGRRLPPAPAVGDQIRGLIRQIVI